jgi:hypothetical protein
MSRQQIVDYIDTAQEDSHVLQYPIHLSHLHFGGEGSFNGEQSTLWINNLKHFLREGFWCTLEVRPAHLSLIYKTGLCRQSRFILLVSLPLLHVRELGYNAVLQIEGNTAAWSIPFAELLQQRGLANATLTERFPIKGVNHEA